MIGRDAIHTEPLIPDLLEFVAHFAERNGGASEGRFRSLNLGFSTGDDPRTVVSNREGLAKHLEVPLDRWVVLGQVHGAEVIRVEPSVAGEGAKSVSHRLPAADAVYLPCPGIYALALAADCPLVALADPSRRRAGVAHAGWRGTQAGVVAELIQAFIDDGTAATDLWAGISPGICGDCYPVGEEVHRALAATPGYPRAIRGAGVDLRILQREVLLAAGLEDRRIHRSPRCSACETDRFFSHRAEGGSTGRNGALVGWRE